MTRYAALRRFLRERADRLSLTALQELTRNHTSFPRSICAHGNEVEPAGTRTRTVAALVQVLAERTLHITSGCACENAYHAIEL